MVGGHKHGFEQVVWFVAQGRGGLQAQARGGNENLLLQEIITRRTKWGRSKTALAHEVVLTVVK